MNRWISPEIDNPLPVIRVDGRCYVSLTEAHEWLAARPRARLGRPPDKRVRVDLE